MLARIYQPAKTAMQSGKARTKNWVLEFEPEVARRIDPLMGWTSSSDMKQQIKLTFDTKQDAIAYAQKHNIPHQVIDPRPKSRVIKAYADNFKYGRLQPWTH